VDRMSRFSPDHRRALIMLVDIPCGCTEDLLGAHGVPANLVAELVKAKPVTAQPMVMTVAGHMITVTRIKSRTRAGRRLSVVSNMPASSFAAPTSFAAALVVG
jgi:hypothetical protein